MDNKITGIRIATKYKALNVKITTSLYLDYHNILDSVGYAILNPTSKTYGWKEIQALNEFGTIIRTNEKNILEFHVKRDSLQYSSLNCIINDKAEKMEFEQLYYMSKTLNENKYINDYRLTLFSHKLLYIRDIPLSSTVNFCITYR